MIKYKLTDRHAKTRPGSCNECRWAPGMVREACGTRDSLCSNSYIHWYDSPEIAVFLNPIHNWFVPARLWEVEASGKIKLSGPLKGGSKRVRIIRELPLPAITPEQRVKIAILCALTCSDEPVFVLWAERWFEGSDRSSNGGAKTSMHLNNLLADSSLILREHYGLKAALQATTAASLLGKKGSEVEAGFTALYAHSVNYLHLQTLIDSVLCC